MIAELSMLALNTSAVQDTLPDPVPPAVVKSQAAILAALAAKGNTQKRPNAAAAIRRPRAGALLDADQACGAVRGAAARLSSRIRPAWVCVGVSFFILMARPFGSGAVMGSSGGKGWKSGVQAVG
jgi:hypothetical protein